MKTFIFDFDGTIADTGALLFSMANQLLEEGGYDPVSEEKLEELRKMTILQAARHMKISPRLIPGALTRGRQMLSDRLSELEPYKGMIETIRELSKIDGVVLGILSSNSKSNVYAFLERYDLIDKFNFIDVGASLFGKHIKLKQSVKKHRLHSEDVIYVGDEVRDIEAAKKAKLQVAAVSWGLNHPEILAKYEPDYLVSSAEELISIAGGKS